MAETPSKAERLEEFYRRLRLARPVSDNGAIEIRNLAGEVELEKPGADGKRIWDP